MSRRRDNNTPTVSKWQDVVDRAVTNFRKNVFVKHEWKKFSDEEIGILRCFADQQQTFAEIRSQWDLLGYFNNDPNFATHCLWICLETHQYQGKFMDLFKYMQVMIVDQVLHLLPQSANLGQMDTLYDAAFMKLVDLEETTDLANMLANAHDPNNQNGLKSVKDNNPALVKACRKDNFDLVRLFVAFGYRLRTSRMTKLRRKKPSQKTWQKYTEMPSLFAPTPIQTTMFEGGDEVNDLHILRWMSQPAYILSCYDTVVETAIDFSLKVEDGTNYPCDCVDRHRSTSKHSNGGITLKQMMQYEGKEENFHYCPANVKFKPDSECQRHPECNDPIFRCFDLAKMASEIANDIPEYRVEYQDVAKQCRSLAVDLLDQCTDTSEVQTLLKESSGAAKYFRYAKTMRYPRLRLAIEHNHKEFVGHMYCQQTLRQQWHGDMIWEGKAFTYKILHLLFQVVLAPLYVTMFLIAEVGRDWLKLREKPVPTKEEIKKTQGCHKRMYLQYLRLSNTITLNLDIPFNRFLMFSGYYVIFVALILTAILAPITDVNLGKDRDVFDWYYVALTVYSLAMLWHDFLSLITLRSLKTFFKFWRVYDLLLHLCLFSGLVTRYVMLDQYPCHNNITNGTGIDGTNSTCAQEVMDKRTNLDDAESILFAVSSTQALMRLMYWFQLHDTIGPVVINMSRVTMDVFTIGGSYFMIAMAFASGLVFIFSTETYKNKVIALNSTVLVDQHNNIQSYVMSFGETLNVLFWAILEPGRSDEIHSEGVRGILATTLFGIYQVVIVIVLLNLLIAVMNATVQKVHDRKQLYWKFARTSVWIEFFDKVSALPAPFAILNIIWMMCLMVFKTIFKVVGLFKTAPGINLDGTIQDPCHYKSEDLKWKNKHATLMMELISRYMKHREEQGSKEQTNM